MDLLDQDASVVPSSQSKNTKDDQMEPGVLLEESWFFGNLLDRKSRMLRCYSDPCPSSNNTPEPFAGKSMEETFSSLKKLPNEEKLNLDSRRSKNPRLKQRANDQRNLQRTPSLPVYGTREETHHDGDDDDDDFSMGKLIRQASLNHEKRPLPKHTSPKPPQNNLQRAPSMPVFEEEIHDHEESDFSMGKLIRQASINNVKKSLPKHSTPKPPQSNLQRAPSLPVFAEDIHDHEENDFSMGKLIRQASLNHARVLPPKHTSKGHTKWDLSRSSTISSEIEELKGFKNLELTNEKKDSKTNAGTGLKEKNKKKLQGGLSELDKIRKPYVSEPNWVPKKSSEDMMKEQIKFWARAVASNVR